VLAQNEPASQKVSLLSGELAWNLHFMRTNRSPRVSGFLMAGMPCPPGIVCPGWVLLVWSELLCVSASQHLISQYSLRRSTSFVYIDRFLCAQSVDHRRPEPQKYVAFRLLEMLSLQYPYFGSRARPARILTSRRTPTTSMRRWYLGRLQ